MCLTVDQNRTKKLLLNLPKIVNRWKIFLVNSKRLYAPMQQNTEYVSGYNRMSDVSPRAYLNYARRPEQIHAGIHVCVTKKAAASLARSWQYMSITPKNYLLMKVQCDLYDLIGAGLTEEAYVGIHISKENIDEAIEGWKSD